MALRSKWKIEDVDSNFKEVVRQVLLKGPQRITVDGVDAVVVMDAEIFEELRKGLAGPQGGTSGTSSPVRGARAKHLLSILQARRLQ